jgi:hypothetical protein
MRWLRIGVVIGVAVALGPIAWLLASRGSQPGPRGIDESGPVPTIPTVLWAWFWLIVLWGVALAFWFLRRRVLERSEGASGIKIADSTGGVLVLLFPFLLLSSCSLYFTAVPGCGEPRAALLKPLPQGVVVVSEEVGEPISGSQKRRELVVASDDDEPRELFRGLVAHYQARGWPLRVSEDVLTDGTDYFVASVSVGDWLLTLGTHYRWDDASRDWQVTDEVRIELSHQPSDDRGCVNL